MKLVVLSLLISPKALAFNAPCQTLFSSKLNAVSTGKGFPEEEWSGYALHKRSDTVPIPSESASRRFAMDDVMIDPNYSLAAAVAALGPLIMWYHPCKLVSIAHQFCCMLAYVSQMQLS